MDCKRKSHNHKSYEYPKTHRAQKPQLVDRGIRVVVEPSEIGVERDWDQTKHDLGANQPDTQQSAKDTVQQASGTVGSTKKSPPIKAARGFTGFSQMESFCVPIDMVLIQILLPLSSNRGTRFSKAKFNVVKSELSGRFDGVTAYSRGAAEGLWRDSGTMKRDEIVVYEVMAKSFESEWWRNYQRQLETRFHQKSVVIRAQKIKLP